MFQNVPNHQAVVVEFPHCPLLRGSLLRPARARLHPLIAASWETCCCPLARGSQIIDIPTVTTNQSRLPEVLIIWGGGFCIRGKMGEGITKPQKPIPKEHCNPI